MSTTLHSFMDIFETEFEAGEEVVSEVGICVSENDKDIQ